MLEFQHYLHSLTRVFSSSRAFRQFKNSLLHSWLQQSQERDTMKAASGHLWWFKIVCFELVDTGTKSSRQEAAKTSNSLFELKLFNEHLADRLTDSFGCCWEEGSTDQRMTEKHKNVSGVCLAPFRKSIKFAASYPTKMAVKLSAFAALIATIKRNKIYSATGVIITNDWVISWPGFSGC